MAMENPDDLEIVRIMDDSVASGGDWLGQGSSTVKESENLDVVILDDLDSYMQDINDRLTISRMVSDSVIKGMVAAVEQEAKDKIAQKESEINRLKERLLFTDVSAAENEVLEFPSMRMNEGGSAESSSNLGPPDESLGHDRVRDFLVHFGTEAWKQLTKLKEQMHAVGQRNSIDSTKPLEKVPERFTDIDRVDGCLQIMLDSFFNQVNNMVCVSTSSFYDSQQEREFQAEVEASVIAIYLGNLQQEFERVLRDQNLTFGLNESINLLKKREKEFSSLRQELDRLNRLLSLSDTSHIASHGSMEISEECGNGGSIKVTDHLHRKLSGSHVFSSSPPWEANGNHEELIIAMPENIDAAKLVHLSRDGLVDHFKSEMIKMKRNHETKVQGMTEEYFRLKREYLREWDSAVPMKKDKDMDELKKKILEVISKLDKILVESDVKCLGSMKERLDTLLSENRQLRDMLADRKREIESLSREVSDAGKKISCYSLAESNLLEVIANLKQEKEEERIKSTVSEEVYKCFLKMLPTDSCCVSDYGRMESDTENVICELCSSRSEIETLYMESVISQDLSRFLFIQALNEAKEKFDCLRNECIYEKVLRSSLELEILEKADLVRSEAAENQRLKEEVLQLAASMEESGRLAEETGNQLAREKELLDQANQELERLMDETGRQGMLIAEFIKESESIKGDLDEASKKLEMYKDKSCKLSQDLDFAREELKRKEEERKLLILAIQEKQDKLLLAEVNERVYKKQTKSVMEVAHGIMKSLADLENRATVGIKRNQSRLDMLGPELISLTQAARLIKRLGLTYKQKLERKCLDLEKAENEVDLLGDEVDNLLSLLEKIYIALDHYSPILKHYPGVMEILKLVKGELSGESPRSASKGNGH